MPLAALASLVAVPACGGSDRGGDRDAGDDGPPVDAGPTGTFRDAGNADGSARRPPPGRRDGGGGSSDSCAARARWIYTIDEAATLIRFEPDSLAFTPVGTLDCPAGSWSTFSMSVDRDARAWVLYGDGEMHHASTTDASCTSTSFEPNQHGFERFGMGFASDGPDTEAETLFVGDTGTENRLGRIDTSTLELTPLGDIPGSPELTGTGDGELWGFFPDSSPPSVRRLDKTNGSTLETFELTELGSVSPSAWAFAFWGGRFYVFLQEFGDPSSNVWRLDPTDGSFEEVVHASGYRIVGAGVSTCAPVDLI